jgi:phosphatidylglycerol:prolipoprotein diacylglycerol transferase
VYLWGIFVGLGILVATWVAARRGRRGGIAPQQLWDLAFWVVLAGIVGARALYVAEYWRDFVGEPWRALAVWEGGMSAFGAILFGLPAGFWYVRLRRLPHAVLMRAVAPALLLGDAIGRLGGAASHMYVGRPTVFPIAYLLNGVQRHEVGMELALASLLGFLVLLSVERRFSSFVIGHSSFTPALVLAWYSLERFLLDFLRASDLPNSDLRYAGLPPVAVAEGGLTLAQIIAVVGIVCALGFWLRGRQPVRRTVEEVRS